jgi:hypothetical protein
LFLGLLTVLIIDYLNREPKIASAPMSLGGIHLHHQPHAMLDISEQQQRVIYEPLKSLPMAEKPRELSHEEVMILFEAADPSIKAIISLVMNGLSLAEILSLTSECLNIELLMIFIPGQRNLLMTAAVATSFRDLQIFDHWPNEDTIKTLLCCAAIDGGLSEPEQITVEALRFTYILFLIRQGIKLVDLTKIVGSLPPSQLIELGRFSPADSGVSLEQIVLDYFAR